MKILIKLRKRFVLPLKYEWIKRRRAKKAQFRENMGLINRQIELDSLLHKYEREGKTDEALFVDGQLSIINELLDGLT